MKRLTVADVMTTSVRTVGQDAQYKEIVRCSRRPA